MESHRRKVKGRGLIDPDQKAQDAYIRKRHPGLMGSGLPSLVFVVALAFESVSAAPSDFDNGSPIETSGIPFTRVSGHAPAHSTLRDGRPQIAVSSWKVVVRGKEFPVAVRGEIQKGGITAKTVSLPVLTNEELQSIFEEAKKLPMSRNMHDEDNACAFREEGVIQLLRDRGLDGAKLKIDAPWGGLANKKWSMHIAAVAATVEGLKVVDVYLFPNGPVGVDEWLQAAVVEPIRRDPKFVEDYLRIYEETEHPQWAPDEREKWLAQHETLPSEIELTLMSSSWSL